MIAEEHPHFQRVFFGDNRIVYVHYEYLCVIHYVCLRVFMGKCNSAEAAAGAAGALVGIKC